MDRNCWTALFASTGTEVGDESKDSVGGRRPRHELRARLDLNVSQQSFGPPNESR